MSQLVGKNTNTKTTPFLLSASSQPKHHSFTPSSSTSFPLTVQGDGEWGAAASPHQLLSATSSSSHLSLLHPGAFPGKHLSQCGRGAHLCPARGQLELQELAVSGSGQPPSVATTTGEPELAQHGRGQHYQQHIKWSPVLHHVPLSCPWCLFRVLIIFLLR